MQTSLPPPNTALDNIECALPLIQVFFLNYLDGCMVVPVGHYTSEQSAFEWRISFNHCERRLSSSLNRVQRHCYCLAKLLLKTSKKLFGVFIFFDSTLL